MFPGYIYVEMTDKAVNNGDVLMMIAGTTNVINFIGGRQILNLFAKQKFVVF